MEKIRGQQKPCAICGKIITTSIKTQKYCDECRIIADKERKKKWEKKRYPDRKPLSQSRTQTEFCCICGKPFVCAYKGEPYCNVHWQRMYHTGSPWLKGIKTGNPYEINGEVVTMTTHDGRTFTIDKDDLNKVLTRTWCYSKTGYLVATINQKTTKLTRFLLNPPRDKVVDHINGDPSDNRRCNLRICTQNENSKNTGNTKGSKNKYVGVRRVPSGKYRANITVDRKSIHIGTYATEEEAFQARLAAERKYFGEFSRNNKRETNEG